MNCNPTNPAPAGCSYIPPEPDCDECRCPECGHPMSEHRDGRCSHVMLDGGYNRDYICSCITATDEGRV